MIEQEREQHSYSMKGSRLIMKQKILALLLAAVVLTSISAGYDEVVADEPGTFLTYLPFFKSPSPSRIENISLPTPWGTSKKVSIYLPWWYDDNEDTYPVLYLMDGQTFIDQVDDVPFIKVGIDSDPDDRWDEFSRWKNLQMEKWLGIPSPEGGGGDQYLTFLIDLKTNHIDPNYKTKPEREYTAIGGYSMGGFFSIFAGITRKDIFSKVIAFSPAVWFGSKDINRWLADNHFMVYISQNKPSDVRFWTYVGGLEDHDHEYPGFPLISEKFPSIYSRGTQEVYKILGGDFIFNPTGTHFPEVYRSYFPYAVDWLGW